MLVSNTSTLVLLAKVGLLEAFIDVSPSIEIPEQVRKEAIFESESYYAKVIKKIISEGKIRVTLAQEEKFKAIAKEFRIGAGEAAAFAIFNPKKHDAILTDDWELIKLCRLEKVPFICALGIIVRLKEKKVISKEKAIEAMHDLKNIGRYSQEIYEHFRHEVE